MGRRGFPLSHIFFADDLVLFCEASVGQLQTVLRVLDNFCECSGQKVNTSKSAFCVSNNVRRELVNDLAFVSGFRHTKNLGKYLGVPVIHSRIGAHYFTALEEKFCSRLSAWKANTLTLAGRITLVQSVLVAIPLYIMQTMVLPVGTCDKIESMCRNFLWGDIGSDKKIHLIKWKKLCHPKKGGVGLRQLRHTNSAYMLKLGWRFLNEPFSLWVKVLRGKYGYDFGKPSAHAQTSCVWRAICKHWDVLQDNIAWDIGFGVSVSFWDDKWLGANTLGSVANEIREDIAKWRVCDAFSMTDGWNVDRNQTILPTNELELLKLHPGPSVFAEPDVCYWQGNPSGKFSLALATKILDPPTQTSPSELWPTIWTWQGPQKIRSFMWLLAQQRLLTNAERTRRHLSHCDLCPLCGCFSKTNGHMVRDCVFAKTIWAACLCPEDQSRFFSLPLHAWMSHNLNNKFKGKKKGSWAVYFGFIAWFIWKWRNDFVFSGRFVPIASKSKIVPSLVGACLESKTALLPNTMTPNFRNEQTVKWKPPDPGWVCLNVDGAVTSDGKLATCGGVFRSDSGRWLGGFSCKLELCSSFRAELCGLVPGLQEAWDRGWRRIHLQSDNEKVVRRINDGGSFEPQHQELFLSIRNILARDWSVLITHVYREANKVTDGMAHLAFNVEDSFKRFPDAPEQVTPLLVEDLHGAGSSRIITT